MKTVLIWCIFILVSGTAIAEKSKSENLEKLQKNSVAEAEKKAADISPNVTVKSEKRVPESSRISLGIENTTTYHSIRVQGKK